MRQLSGILFLIVGLGCVALVAWFLRREDAPQSEQDGRPPYQLPVTVAEVERADLTPRAALTGTVRAAREADLAFEVAGRIVSIAAVEGVKVEEGSSLARLENADQKLAVDLAVAELELAQRRLERTEAGSRAEQIARLEAELTVARAEQELAEEEVKRGRSLVERDILSQQEMDRLAAEEAVAAGRTRAAEQRLNEALAGEREEDKRIDEASVGVVRQNVARAERELEKTILRAPWTGVVVRRHKSTGDHVLPGESVFELVDTLNREIVLEVPGRFAARTREELTAVISSDEHPDFRLELPVHARIPAADERSRNYRVLLRFGGEEDPELRLEPGMFVRVELTLYELKDILVVPSDAVRTTDSGLVLVRVGPEGAAEWVPVRLLGEEDGRSAVEPKGGVELAAGEQIVVTGVDLAFPGVPLMIRETENAGAENRQ